MQRAGIRKKVGGIALRLLSFSSFIAIAIHSKADIMVAWSIWTYKGCIRRNDEWS